MLPVTSSELVAVLDSLDAPIVITKNIEADWSENFRPDSSVEGRYLDGFWATQPRRVEQGHGYVLHHVVQESVVWLGAFGGVVQDGGDRYSYVLDAATCFRLSDFGQSTDKQRELWTILKQPGPVVTYHEPRGIHYAEVSVALTVVKCRPQQANFRLAVLAHHGTRCKITGCTVPELLDAAHLRGRDWQQGHNAPTDGIPLRVDLHRAYDRGLIELDDQSRLIAVGEELRGQYDQFLHA
jgi:hypothetical protein